jgi:hypothetical protein
MSWLFSQALVEAFSEESFSDGEPSAPLSGNPIQQAYCAPDKMTAFCRLSRFGMTFKPLTEDRGEALLMSYLAAFPAKTFQPPEGEQESMANDQGCGEKWRGWLAKYDPDSCSWKTPQCSLLGDLDEFSETWPRWGLMRNGECWDMTTSVVNIGVNESGLLPTPTKNLFSHWSSALAKQSNDGRRKSGVKVGSILWWEMTEHHLRLGGIEDKKMIPDPSCGEVVMGWPMGWTELQPLEMDKFREWLRQHGEH